MAIGRNSPGMHIGVFQGSSVVYLGYSEEYINKSCTSNTYLIENPTKNELEIRDKPEIAFQLFKLINFIANEVLTSRKEIREFYNENIPDTAKRENRG